MGTLLLISHCISLREHGTKAEYEKLQLMSLSYLQWRRGLDQLALSLAHGDEIDTKAHFAINTKLLISPPMEVFPLQSVAEAALLFSFLISWFYTPGDWKRCQSEKEQQKKAPVPIYFFFFFFLSSPSS